MKPVLAVDFDDTLCPTHNYLERIALNGFQGDSYWNIWSANNEVGLPYLVKEMNKQSMLDLEPLPGAIDAITRLAERWHIVVLTGRPMGTEACTRKYVEKWFGETIKDVYFTHKDTVSSQKNVSKYAVCLEKNIHTLVDDWPSRDWSNAVDLVVFGRYVWQNTLTLPPACTLCENWTSVEKYLL